MSIWRTYHYILWAIFILNSIVIAFVVGGVISGGWCWCWCRLKSDESFLLWRLGTLYWSQRNSDFSSCVCLKSRRCWRLLQTACFVVESSKGLSCIRREVSQKESVSQKKQSFKLTLNQHFLELKQDRMVYECCWANQLLFDFVPFLFLQKKLTSECIL